MNLRQLRFSEQPSKPAVDSATRFRATFTQPGIYQYKCVLHDELGMVGVIIVLP